MKLERTAACDVLVIGCGIAGISAAIAAAEKGRSVTLLCGGNKFSGSSFYPGTWGLGLIGPDGKEDERDLMESIQTVGCKMADPALVERFVTGITPAIEKIRAMGIYLKRADHTAEREFIPCFDRKHRDWNLLVFESAKKIFSEKLKELSVSVIPHCEVLELAKNKEHVCGAVAVKDGKLCYFGAKTTVLATGGYGSIFKHHLCTEDVTGMGQALALRAGCELINMEFMQMMPGYLKPAYKTVFNEKTFRFTHVQTPDGEQLHWDKEQELLNLRSGHGPFTSRLASAEIDKKLFSFFQKDERGVTVTFDEKMRSNPPELIRSYFEWLKEVKGVSMEDAVSIGIFSHAANGGIRIDCNGWTGVAGLYAAGEVTGGMHGADRIGGLSTANGLVFGQIAGESAADACGELAEPCDIYIFDPAAVCDVKCLTAELQELMYHSAMVLRSQSGLEKALSRIEEIQEKLVCVPAEDAFAAADAVRLRSRLKTAQCVVKAALLRTESRGAHFREDYPQQDETLEKQILVRLDEQGCVHVDYCKK